jgi:tubulin---tyrosine ligase
MGGHKFHLRVYVLCVGALRVFVYEKMLILIAAHRYDLNDTDNIYGHLTNTARAAEDVHFDEKKFVKVLEDLPQYLVDERPDIAPSMAAAIEVTVKIKEDIFSITNELFNAFDNEYTVFAPMNNCFEVFGLDFMVDEDLQTSLLEVNPGPDFKQTGDKLKVVIEELWEQTLQIVLDQNKEEKNVENLNSSRSYGCMEKAAKDFTCVYSKESSTSHLKGGMSFT